MTPYVILWEYCYVGTREFGADVLKTTPDYASAMIFLTATLLEEYNELGIEMDFEEWWTSISDDPEHRDSVTIETTTPNGETRIQRYSICTESCA